ncbi:uncharacterized protein LOC129572990, partial [Sitodiplosis mosellana]|uniref:uncharacterized protein LOC129572990 n=1 Tax=Sitodiplosis mosellana TaxID=263140 RepID=UPI002444C0F5
MKKFWEFEDLPLCSSKCDEDEMVEQMFIEGHSRDETGRHTVTIPIKPTVQELGSSREAALRRFFGLEKRFARDPAYRADYVERIKENIAKGYMMEANIHPEPGEMVYYIPHHAVYTSGKFRIVYDASCLTNKGISLNDAQFVGPKLQRNLYETIMRFRRHKVAVSADIKSMYLQVCINPKQWNLQRIFWRESPADPLKEYWLVVVTFGLSSSTYLAVRTMLEGAAELENEYPEAVHAIRNDFYMDDCTTGASDEQKAVKLAKEMKLVLEKSGFPLCKRRSNSEYLVQKLEGEHSSVSFDENNETAVLGLKWITTTDEITYEVREPEMSKELTKRSILSKIGRLYDPNGFIAPIITLTKLLMRDLWNLKVDWDEPVPPKYATEWNAIWSQILHLEKIRIPRWFGMSSDVQVQLHGFADASGKCYGCSIYLRIEDLKGQIRCDLIASKSKIAPQKIKPEKIPKGNEQLNGVSIPRLELAAAELLSRYFSIVRDAMELQNVPFRLWTDSSTALQWIHKPVHELKVFVANRVKKIREVSTERDWFHVRTHDNPADLISRGVPPSGIVQNNLWWHGPPWLSKLQSEWPEPLNIRAVKPSIEMQEEIKAFRMNAVSVRNKKLEVFVPQMKEGVPLIDYSNDLSKLTRILAFVMRFIRVCRDKTRTKPKQIVSLQKLNGNWSQMIGLTTEDERRAALKYFITEEQKRSFPLEYEHFIEKTTNEPKSEFPAKSHLLDLRPFLDKDGIIRACGRLGGSDLPYDARHPVIIPSKSRLSYLIAWEAHSATKHGSIQLMLQYIRANYWIPRLRLELRSYLSNCITCIRYAKHFETQLMAELPADRVRQNRPFLITGVDYAGPFELSERYKSRTKVMEHLNKKGTQWVFMKPAAPHQGGIYEAAVKSAKCHLKRVVGTKSYTYEQLITFLVQIEAVLNSRPLYALSDEPTDMQVITPGHFLIGESFILPPPIAAPAKSDYSLKRVRDEQQKMLQAFWKSWQADYLATLLPRKKWLSERPFETGQLVLIKDENLPPAQWQMGRIKELILSKDDLVRSVVILLPSKDNKQKTLVRPVQKIRLLPVEPEQELKNEHLNAGIVKFHKIVTEIDFMETNP